MASILSQKVNCHDFVQLHSEKASKCDLENQMDSLKIMHDQLKHAIVLLSESVKLNLNSTVLSKNMQEAKAVQLSQ